MKKHWRKLLTLSLAAALCLSLAACGTGTKSTEAEGESASTVNLNYGISNAWDSLMPYYSISGTNYSRIIYDKIYDRLVYVHPDGTCDPRAAESWESTDDGMACVFHLNPDCAFHDGTPVTAQSWVETIQMLTQPDCGILGPTFSALAGTDTDGKAVAGETLGVEALDDTTLKLTFKTPTIPEEFLVEWNRDIYVLPTHLLKDIPAAELVTDDFWLSPIGSGPCKFASELAGSSIVLEANEDYQLGAPGFDTMTVTVMDKENLLTSLISGDIDYYAFGDSVSEEERAIAEDAGFEILEGTVPATFFELMLNNESLSDPTLRQAINMALDKELLCQQNAGTLGTATSSSILPDTPYAGAMTEGTYDPQGAAELVAQSDYQGQTLTLATTSARADLAAIIQQNLADAGITIEIETVDSATMFSGINDGVYDMGLASHTPTSLPLWFTGSRFTEVNNIFRVADLTPYQDLVSAINQETDEHDRIALVDEFEQYLGEQMPFVPLWFSNYIHVVSNTIEGIDYPSSSFSNENVWEWTVSK